MKNLTMKLRNSISIETEKLAKRLSISCNLYINQVLECYE